MYHCFSSLLKKLQGHGFQIHTKDQIRDITKSDWNWDVSNWYLSYDFLETYETIFQHLLQFKYVLIFKNGVPVFKTCFQIKDFQASELGDILEKEIVDIRKRRYKLLAKLFNQYSEKNLFRVITCGNVIITGQNAFYYNAKTVKESELLQILMAVTDEVESIFESVKRISCILIKDFYNTTIGHLEKETKDLFCVQVEPEMKVAIPKKITSIEEYIQLFSKKYRNRAKSILEKQSGITKKINIDKTNIIGHNQAIHALYKKVIQNADFNLLELPENYFQLLLQNHGDQFKMVAYFKDEEMIAFRSAFYTKEKLLEAHFIDLNYEWNKELELYQNILYDYIAEAIQLKCETLSLGRTASEIKTTVGAVPHTLNCFIKPSNTISELVIQPFLKYLQPRPFEARHPFKSTEVLPTPS